MGLSTLPPPRRRKRHAADRVVNEWRDGVLALIWEISEDYWDWSLTKLADEAQLSPHTVYNLHSGLTVDCRSSTLAKLAQAAGMTLCLRSKDGKLTEIYGEQIRSQRNRRRRRAA